MEKYENLGGVTLVESARTTHLEFVSRESPTIVVTCSAALYEKHMRARCEKKGKRFRDDYWNAYKLEYECHRRYINYCEKSGIKAAYFLIEDQARDWPAVDEYFSTVFRRLHNARVK